MSTMPTNPLFDAIKNWQRVATQTVGGWRTRLNAIRAQWYQRFYGPKPTGFVGPLMRLRGMQGGGAALQRVSPQQGYVSPQQGYVIPHASRPGYEQYDMTYRGPSTTPPFTTQRRLGLEGENYDFTY